MGAALKYLGYSLNTTDQGQLDEAKAIVADATSRVAAYESDQYDELLVSGQHRSPTATAATSSCSSSRLRTPSSSPTSSPKRAVPAGSTTWLLSLTLRTRALRTFINFLLDAENGAALTNWNYYASPNAAAVPFIDQEVLDDPIVYLADQSKLEFIADTGDFEIEFSDALNEARG